MQYVIYFHASRAAQRVLAASLPPADKKSALFGAQQLYKGAEERTEALLAATGIRSVLTEWVSQGRLEYDAEDIIRWNPDYIFIAGTAAIDELKNTPRFHTLAAVKNDHVVQLPLVGHVWRGSTVEAPLAGFWVMSVVYPQLLSRQTLEHEIRYLYETFFACRMTDKDIQTILGEAKHD